jgi:hypothetical protein
MWHNVKSCYRALGFVENTIRANIYCDMLQQLVFQHVWRWIRRRWNFLSTRSFHPLQSWSTKWPSHQISWSSDRRRRANAADHTNSRTLTTGIFLWGFTKWSRLHRKSEIYLIYERQLTSFYSENASKNMARSSVPSRYLQGKKRCSHWHLRYETKHYNLDSMLQQNQIQYLSSHASYFSERDPAFYMGV